jgi:hypothetical protein
VNSELLETWQINARINLYLLEAIAPEALPSVPLAKGRSVAEQFAHIHNVRLMWLKAAAPGLQAGVEKIDTDGAITKDGLKDALEKSGAAIGALLQSGLENKGKIKGFKPHAVAFSRLLDRARGASPRPNQYDSQTGRTSPGQENRVRPMGVGRALSSCLGGG